MSELLCRKTIQLWGMFVVLALLPAARGYCLPPIRCVHQTTVIKDGKATTHLILTTAKPGEARTANNTADVVYPGLMGSIVTNADQSLAAVTFSLDLGPDIYHTALYLFVSTERQHLQVIPNFQVSVTKALLIDPTRTGHNTSVGRSYWNYIGGPKESQPSKAELQNFLKEWREAVNQNYQHEFSVSEIDGSLLSMRADRADINEIFFKVKRHSDGKLSVTECWSEGE